MADLAAGFVAGEHAHAARQHDVQRVAAVALLDQDGALAVVAHHATLGQRSHRLAQRCKALIRP